MSDDNTEPNKSDKSFTALLKPSKLAIGIMVLLAVICAALIWLFSHSVQGEELAELGGMVVGQYFIGPIILCWFLSAVVWVLSGRSAGAARKTFTISLVFGLLITIVGIVQAIARIGEMAPR